MKAVSSSLLFRKASAKDARAICEIVNYWARLGKMLPRTEQEVLDNLADFFVVKQNRKTIACGAVAPYGSELGEFRSIAVAPEYAGTGVGRFLLQGLLQRAKRDKYPRVFVFTYVPGFFEKLGFRIVPPESLPQKAWKDCWRCPKREGCDEIAMVKII